MSNPVLVRGFIKDDGGRMAAGFGKPANDCVARAVAIASGRPYAVVYGEIAEINARMPKTKARSHGRSGVGQLTADKGVYTESVLFKRYMAGLGFTWVATMGLGTGCRVHLRAVELPRGRIIVRVTRHLAAVIDGVLHDTHDCSRGGKRCVYGYWRFDKRGKTPGGELGGRSRRASVTRSLVHHNRADRILPPRGAPCHLQQIARLQLAGRLGIDGVDLGAGVGPHPQIEQLLLGGDAAAERQQGQ